MTAEGRQELLRACLVAKAALRREDVAKIQARIEALVKKRLELKLKKELDGLWKQIRDYVKDHPITATLGDDAIDWAAFDARLAFSIRGELRIILESVGAKVDAIMSVTAGWDLVQDQTVIDWLNTHTAELVVQVSGETRAAIQSVCRENYMNWLGTNTRTMARELRPIVGLTQYQKTIVDNFRARLEQGGVSGAKLESMVAKKAEAIRRYRCQLIADTESVFAANQGALATYRANSQVTASQWYVTSGAPCEECAALDGTIMGIDESYAQREVKVEGVAETRDVKCPPLHPNCGCSLLPCTVETEQDQEFWDSRKEKFAQNFPEGWLERYRRDVASA